MNQAWRSLTLGERWQLSRAASMGRCETDPARARIVAWRAERALEQLDWQLPLLPVLLAALYGLAWWLLGMDVFVPGVFHTAFFTVFYAIVGVPRLRRAVRLNTRVVAGAGAGRPAQALTEPPDPRLRLAWLVGVVGAVVLLAGLVAVRMSPVPPPAPAALADGGPPGEVPQAVADRAEGRVVAGRLSPGLPPGAEDCDVVAEWQAGPVISPVVVADRSTFVVYQGVGRARFFGTASWTDPGDRPNVGYSVLDPQPLIALCEHGADGSLMGFAIAGAQPLDGQRWFGGFGSSGQVTPDRQVVATADWRVPESATWALLEHDGWTLALPVVDVPVVRLRWAATFEDWARDEGGRERRLLFVDDAGTVLEDTVVGGS